MPTGRKDTKIKELQPNDKPMHLSIVRAEELSKMISEGKSRAAIIEFAKNKYGVKDRQARRLWDSAVDFLMPDNEDEYRHRLIQANFERLEKIIDKALEEDNLKAATEAINVMNKMLGVSGGMQIGIKNDMNNNTQEFIVKLNGE